MAIWKFFKSTGFGIERLGLVAIRWPKAVLASLALFTLLLAGGLFNVGFNADMRDVFRSQSADYKALERMTAIFPGSEFDAMLLIEGKDIFTPGNLEALRSLHLDMNFIDGVKGVISIFSVRSSPNAAPPLQPLIPAQITPENMRGLKEKLVKHPLVDGKLLSKNGDLALFIISLDTGMASMDERKQLFAQIREFAGETLGATGLEFTLAGKPVLYARIVDELIRDQLLFKILGLSLSGFIAWLFFRRLNYVILASMPPLLATIWLFGLMGWLGIKVNTLNNVVPTLVMIIAFTNAVHMLFALRRYKYKGEQTFDAMRDSVLEVGPATVLATLTTAIALLSLTATGHLYIILFGLLAAMGALISLFTVLLLVPSASVLIIKDDIAARRPAAEGLNAAVLALCQGAARLVNSWPRLIFISGIAVALLAAFAHSRNNPRYLYKEFLPEASPSIEAMEKIDTSLSGATALYVFLQWPKNYDMHSPQTIELVQKVHNTLLQTKEVKHVWSLQTLMQWLGGNRQDDAKKLFDHLQKNANATNTRLISFEHRAALVTGYLEVLEASRFVPVTERLEARLAPLRKAYPGVEISISGIAAVSARSTSNMIWLLNRSLFLAIVFNIFLIGLCFRSVRYALYSVLPNITPIVIAGAVLYFTGQGLQFTSIVAFTIAFGIAVDNTIHFLHRFRLERDRGKDSSDAISAVLNTVGPVLSVTTIILAAGLGVTMLSHLPMVQLYGRLSVLILIVALIADIVLLPAILKTSERKKDHAAKPAR